MTIVASGSAGAAPASAASASPAVVTVINGCKIVANPNPTQHTRCPSKDLSGVDLSGYDLSYADFARDEPLECGVWRVVVRRA
jgi:hypothetical protein